MIIKYRHNNQYNIDINIKVKYPNINDLIIESYNKAISCVNF